MLLRAASRQFDHGAGFSERRLHELGVGHLLRDAAREEIAVGAPGLQRLLLAGGRDIGIVKTDRGPEYLELGRHRAVFPYAVGHRADAI